MVLERLGTSIYEAIKKFFRAPIIDEELVKELLRSFQRALLQADINAELVLQISERIKERVLKLKVPPGISRREHIIKVIYEELTRLLGEKHAALKIQTGKRNTLLLVGIQGSGKSTSVVKIARYYQKRGLKTALICTDTFRPGAYAQLQQLAEKSKISVYGDMKTKNSVKIALDGLEKFNNYDLVVIDTAGRHKDEKGLIAEMKALGKAINPNEIVLVIDGTIGQQASTQAKAFHETTPIGSVFVAKLDGSARGGGALSAVAAIGAPITFIGTGEKIDDIETFTPSRFVGRLLGMGDLESLIERVREAEEKVPEQKVKKFLSGKFNLTDVYEQFEAMKSIGPFRNILKMFPGFAYEIPEEILGITEDRLKKWPVIIKSMTLEERQNPKVLTASRIRRVARGSGTSEKNVRELIKQYSMMKKMVKPLRRKMGRKRVPFAGKKFPLV